MYFEEKTAGSEYVFEATLGSIEDVSVLMRICSSIDANTERVREDSKDSIKVHLTDKYGDTLVLNGERYKHIQRTSGWEGRVQDRVAEYRGKFPSIVDTCPKCGRPLKIKSSGSNRFKGCTGWAPEDADCEYADSL